jgi:hypothetical protein
MTTIHTRQLQQYTQDNEQQLHTTQASMKGSELLTLMSCDNSPTIKDVLKVYRYYKNSEY